VGRHRGAAVFVGRSFELAVLREAWSAGPPRWVLVGGEAGIGKTRLVTEFAGEVSAQGARVVVGNCPPVAPGLVPFAPVAEVLRELGEPVAESLARGHAEAISRLLEVDVPAGRSRMPGEAERARLLGAVRAVLERACGEAPLLVVFEDLQWADASTREVLAFLGSQPPRGRLMFVGTYRDDQRPEGSQVWGLVDRLSRLGGHRLDLSRLGRADLEGLLAGLIGRRPDSAMVEAVLSRSEGNPFLAEELVAADALSGTLPEGLRNLLLARMLDLPEAARQVVGLAAVAGVAVDHDLLEEAWLAAYGQDTALAGALRRAVTVGVLAGVAGQRRYAFRHALVREAVYDDMLPGERSRWHRELARCLAATSKSSRGTGYAARAAWIAHHWLAAGDRVRALAAAIDAGQAAEQTSAFGEASRQYRAAADLWQELGAGPAGVSLWTLSQLYERAALTSYLSGEAERAIAEVGRAIELADTRHERTRVGLMHERRGRYRWSAGHPHADTLRDFRTAVELVPDEPTPARARVLAAMGQTLMLEHRFSEAISVTVRALTVARTAGSPPEVLAHALSTLGVCRAYSGDVAEGIRLAEESVRVAAQVSHNEELHRANGNLSCVLMLEDLRRAAQVALEGAQIAGRDGLAMTYGNFLTGNAAVSLLALGEWAQVEALTGDVVSGPATEPVVMGNLVVSSVVLAAWRGDRAGVDRDLAQIDAALARGGHADMRSRLAVAAAEAATWCRAYSVARGYVIAAADTDADTDDLDMRPQVAALGLRLAAEWPTPEPATESERQALIRRMLALITGAGCQHPPGRQGQAYLRTAEAEASRLTGPGDPALWRVAVEAWERIPSPHRAGYARLRLAEALLGRPGHRRQAEAELTAARDVAERLGARSLAEEIEQLTVRARLGSAPGPDHRFGLTQRERDVLGLVCAGRTNRQIAAQLFITPKTSGLHVSHILAKLNVTTRGEAAALAHRLGLQAASTAGPDQVPGRPGRGG
jgi:DNA-binding CsgD family transcriptional regulator/tetratricopeptide (TPR) repeat protein